MSRGTIYNLDVIAITKIGSGITPRGGQAIYLKSGIPLIRSQNVHLNTFQPLGLAYISAEQDNLMQSSRVVKGDVLLNITGASIGRVCVVPNDLCPANVNQHVSIIRSDESIDPAFLAFYISNPEFQKLILELESGATRQALTKTQIENFIIPLPTLKEQQRIVAILNEKMEAISAARTATLAQIEAASALPGAYFRQVFNSPEAQTWEKVSIGDISTFITDGPHITPTYVRKGISFLTVSNIVNRKIDLSNVSYISEEQHKQFSNRVRAEKGDILYTKDGTLGIPCVVDTDLEFSFFVSVAIIKLIKQRADPHFVAFNLDSDSVLKQVELLGSGAGLKHMVIKSIKALQINLPLIEEQKKIAQELKEKMLQVTIIQNALQSQLEAINALPAAILRQAFNGEL
ncbi:MAG: restriction endonuclease subunit S [Cyanobacteriota bacterium]